MPGSVSNGYRGGFVVSMDDGGELLAKVCGLLGSVIIPVCVAASNVISAQNLNDLSDQGNGMG